MSFPDFTTFFETCHDAAPYRWQVRLADLVVGGQRWPSVVDLPTGAGKTCAIDIALYALARSAHEGHLGRCARRIVLVVDRRVLVDQAWRHGEALLARVRDEQALTPVREALTRLSPEPPSCVRLRGACPTDPRWCRTPDQVQIVASTVDQVGSRLLLRGYGASPGMRPIEAGLLGQDSLFLLDEAHLSGPLLSTLGHLERLGPVRGMARRGQVVQLSATPATVDRTDRFTLAAADREDPALALRLNARKSIVWSDAPLPKLVADTDAPCVLLVANTVATALRWMRAVGGAADVGGGSSPSARECHLVTGRMRPLDRQRVVDAVESRLAARQPTLVIATQCIEAGVDWDFDAMISECASWDSLVQRMGRVNRRGGREAAACVIVPAHRNFRHAETNQNLCPVYGEHEIATAEWLESAQGLECSPGALPPAPAGCVRPVADAPVLLPEYLDLWSQNRAAGPAYDVSVFLHGVREDRHVQVIWRDLDLRHGESMIGRLLEALPPSSLESVGVPVDSFRKWLGQRQAAVVGEGISIAGMDGIGLGSTVVVPCDYGGVGPHGTFDATERAPVADLCEAAMREHRRLEFAIVEAPTLDEDESIEDQVATWISEDENRHKLGQWDWVDLGPRWLFVSQLPERADDDARTFLKRPVTLERHINGVCERTRSTAKRLGLPDELVEDLALAAKLHDIGKLDERFQRLCGRPSGSAALGKSALGGAWMRQRERLSCYPRGERHEALSAALVARNGLHAHAHDPQLVEHLVASHHGWARPFIRAAQGSAPLRDTLFGIEFDIDIAHDEAVRAPGRFREVQDRYGWLGLAWLESILRLSDQRQSEGEAKGELGPLEGDALSSGSGPVKPAAKVSEIVLATFNGLVASDYLAVLGLLRAFDLAGERPPLLWRGTLPVLRGIRTIDQITDLLMEVRGGFRMEWPFELNKLSPEQCEDLLLTVREPFRPHVVAMLTRGGRSDMDFVSSGRGGFKGTCEWVTTHESRVFSRDMARKTLCGPRELVNGKSFRWAPLAAQGARRPEQSSADQRSEPWIEWLALLGVSALVCVPEVRPRGRLGTRSTAVYGRRREDKRLRWPLWKQWMTWREVPAALAGTQRSLHDAVWCEARRLLFGTGTNVVYGLGPGSPVWPGPASRSATSSSLPGDS